MEIDVENGNKTGSPQASGLPNFSLRRKYRAAGSSRSGMDIASQLFNGFFVGQYGFRHQVVNRNNTAQLVILKDR
jgi:hypothetical protein